MYTVSDKYRLRSGESRHRLKMRTVNFTRLSRFIVLLGILACTLYRMKPLIHENVICLTGKVDNHSLRSIRKHVAEVLQAETMVISTEMKHRGTQYDSELRVHFVYDDISIEEFFLRHAPAWKESESGNYLGGLPGFEKGHGAYQLKDRWLCEKYISLREQQRRGKVFRFVGIGRADLLWLAKHPLVSPAGCWIPCKRNDWNGVCDQWAWCTRSAARIYMTEPLNNVPLNISGAWYNRNTESHLLTSLQNFNVTVARGSAAFVRRCEQIDDKCKAMLDTEPEIMNYTTFAKKSGEQIESVKDQLLFAALKQVFERQEPSPD